MGPGRAAPAGCSLSVTGDSPVTSNIEPLVDYPKEISDLLGGEPAQLPGSYYVLCPKCDSTGMSVVNVGFTRDTVKFACTCDITDAEMWKHIESVKTGMPADVVAIRMADVKPQPISWLWPDKIALGKVSMFAGDPGLGKSMLTTAMAACVTTGSPWPVTCSPCPIGDVIMLSAEDDPADTIRPRLDAAGADPARVYQLTAVRDDDGEHMFSLDRDLYALESLLIRLPDCRLVTIDPISAYMGGTDSHKNSDVRSTLAPLQELASRHKVAIVTITHLNKGGGGNAMYRATGSLAFVAAARAAFAVTKDHDDPMRRLVLPVKNNIGNDHTGLAYRIATAENGAPVITWEPAPVEISADDALEAISQDDHCEREDAADWLRDVLSDGPVATTELQKQAKMAGHAWRTVRRAKDRIGAVSVKQSYSGKWVWQFPQDGQDGHQDAQDVHPVGLDTLGESGHLGSNSQYPDGLMDAAARACQGLKVTAGQFIAELEPDDYSLVISHPETARSVAERMAYRK